MANTALIETIPRPVEVGAQMEALRPFHRRHMERDDPGRGHGPGTPVQLAQGRASHHWIQGGRWVVGDYEQDQLLEDGTFVLKWELHWVCGWDPVAAEYKATIADNYGRVSLLRGHIDGNQMVFESIGDEPPYLRSTWILSSGGKISWRNEMSPDGQTWILIEDYEITPTD
ncbi:MAG TPA: hypothetical protein VF115_14650 [Acidimicrobiia bacterium]